jgi:hypothetical protein
MHMWHHVTNHLITSNDKDSNSENRIKLRVRDNDLLDKGLAQHQYLDPEAAAAHNDRYLQFTYDNSESELGAPEEQDFTIHSHLSAGLTPVLVPETLSAHSGKNTSQGTTLWPATPSQERQSQS